MSDILERVLGAFAVAVLAAVVGVGGLGFLGYAGHAALTLFMPPAVAGALMGLFCLLLSALLLLACRGVARPRARPDSAGGSGNTELAALLGRYAGGAVRDHFREAAGIAFVSGFVLGISPRARRALRDLLVEGR